MAPGRAHDLDVRRATFADGPWIQARYREVGFVPSDLEREFILIAWHGGERAGVGRLVPLPSGDAELGGILVLEPYRRLGIADRVVAALLEQRRNDRRVYCLPFAHLAGFYRRHGFRELESDDVSPPESLLRKHGWCLSNYEDRTLLMVLGPGIDDTPEP